MTKKEEEQRKKLTWRLSDLPTAAEVADLVNAGVLERDEARQILIKEEVPMSDKEETEALKEMVRTLQDAVRDLMSRPTIAPYTKVVEVQPRYRPYWDTIFMSGSLNSAPAINLVSLSTSAGKGTYSLSSSNLNTQNLM